MKAFLQSKLFLGVLTLVARSIASDYKDIDIVNLDIENQEGALLKINDEIEEEANIKMKAIEAETKMKMDALKEEAKIQMEALEKEENIKVGKTKLNQEDSYDEESNFEEYDKEESEEFNEELDDLDKEILKEDNDNANIRGVNTDKYELDNFKKENAGEDYEKKNSGEEETQDDFKLVIENDVDYKEDYIDDEEEEMVMEEETDPDMMTISDMMMINNDETEDDEGYDYIAIKENGIGEIGEDENYEDEEYAEDFDSEHDMKMMLRAVPCTSLDTIEFPSTCNNINWNAIRKQINKKLKSMGCGHKLKQEIKRLGGKKKILKACKEEDKEASQKGCTFMIREELMEKAVLEKSTRRDDNDDNEELEGYLVGEEMSSFEETTDPNGFECEMDDGKTLPLVMGKKQQEQLTTMLNDGNVTPGEDKFQYSLATVSMNGIEVPQGVEISFEKNPERKNRRKLVKKSGNTYYLVVRVIDKNGLAHPHNTAIMSDNMFGTNGDRVNLKSQIYDCSAGKLRVIPGYPSSATAAQKAAINAVTVNRGHPVGFMEARINVDIRTSGRGAIRNAVNAKVNEMLGFNLPGPFDHVVFNLQKCYKDCGWAAYAYINSWNQVYQSNYYLQTGVLVHEYGHNLGMAHSGGLNKKVYTDHTCMMGNPLYSDDVGKMCYNPAKNYYIGWYDDGIEEFNPAVKSQWSGTLMGVGQWKDYPAKYPVVLKIETGTPEDYFVGFNRAAGANADNDEADNLVTIVQTGKNGLGYSQSWLKGYIGAGESYTFINWQGSNKDLIITVRKIDTASNPGTAQILISTNGTPTPSLRDYGATPRRKLHWCEGDCDSDSDCANGFTCFQREGNRPVPGCSGAGRKDYDYCIKAKLTDRGASPRGKLQMCEGDCDRDSDCGTGLKCFQRNGHTAVPGCSGSGRKDYDYCAIALADRGVNPQGRLSMCEGDCDNDSQCAYGLKCFQRNGYTDVPGCVGPGLKDYDYCYVKKGGGGGGGGSCVSGSTGIPSENGVKQVRDIKIGDKVHGFDVNMKESKSCKIEAHGRFGTRFTYGNYTEDHFVYNEETEKIQEHGKVGEEIETDIYDMISDCPLVEDESGNRFGAIDSDFCGGRIKNLSWKNYLLLHQAILNVVRSTGTYWFSSKAYKDMDSVRKYAPAICKNMLKCMKNNKKCNGLEKASEKFISKALTDEAKKNTLKTFTNVGSLCMKGSVSAIVTSGKTVDDSLIGTANC